jgi:hypothetical protein
VSTGLSASGTGTRTGTRSSSQTRAPVQTQPLARDGAPHALVAAHRAAHLRQHARDVEVPHLRHVRRDLLETRQRPLVVLAARRAPLCVRVLLREEPLQLQRCRSGELARASRGDLGLVRERRLHTRVPLGRGRQGSSGA